MRLLGSTTESMEMNLSKLLGDSEGQEAGALQSRSQRIRHDLATEQ